jgi:hypothetical protein
VHHYLPEQNELRSWLSEPIKTTSIKASADSSTEKMYYKGYVIEARPHQLADLGDWTIDISIWRHTESESKTRSFSCGNTLKTKAEAINHCMHFGKQIIDGRYSDCSLDDF